MAAAILRLLALVALVLMPLGMAGAPAMARPAPAGHAMSGHCDEAPDQDRAPSPEMDCTAMCTALPAADGPAPDQRLKPVVPRTIAAIARFSEIEPEIATPPPRTQVKSTQYIRDSLEI